MSPQPDLTPHDRYDEPTEAPAAAIGTVKWFSAERGCGFIVPDGGGTPLFVDCSEVVGADLKTLVEDAKVQYERTEGEYGPEATNVVLWWR